VDSGHGRFLVIAVTKDRPSSAGTVFQAADGTFFVFSPARTRSRPIVLRPQFRFNSRRGTALVQFSGKGLGRRLSAILASQYAITSPGSAGVPPAGQRKLVDGRRLGRRRPSGAGLGPGSRLRPVTHVETATCPQLANRRSGGPGSPTSSTGKNEVSQRSRCDELTRESVGAAIRVYIAKAGYSVIMPKAPASPNCYCVRLGKKISSITMFARIDTYSYR